jgi:hypothetical protein
MVEVTYLKFVINKCYGFGDDYGSGGSDGNGHGVGLFDEFNDGLTNGSGGEGWLDVETSYIVDGGIGKQQKAPWYG